MTNRISAPKRRRLSASVIRQAIADDLMQIKSDDRLTFEDIGRVLGKSADQAARYCDGTAAMCAETYVFAREAWNGRFTGRLDALLATTPDTTPDRVKGSSICRAALAVSVMLEDDEITDDEIRDARKTLEEGRDAFDALLRRIQPKAVG
jgi:uncharacterized membrane protein